MVEHLKSLRNELCYSKMAEVARATVVDPLAYTSVKVEFKKKGTFDGIDDIVEISPANAAPSAPKRRMDEAAPESGDGEIAAKKRKVAEEKAAASEDVVCID